MTLFPRYEYDAEPIFYLNKRRVFIRNTILNLLKFGFYRQDVVDCANCGSKVLDHQIISSKERHGLPFISVICTICGLIFTNPRMNQSSYDHFYKNYYRDLYEIKSSKIIVNQLFDSEYRSGNLIFENLSPYLNSGEKLLEIGCGPGGLLQLFREKGFEVKGIDLGGFEVDWGVDEYQLDISSESLYKYEPSETFDVIIAIHVIEHFVDFAADLEKISSFLLPGGLLYIETPSLEGLVSGDYRHDYLGLMQNAHTFHFSESQINDIMEKLGFKLIKSFGGLRNLYKLDKFQKNLRINSYYKYNSDLILHAEKSFNLNNRLMLTVRKILKTLKLLSVVRFTMEKMFILIHSRH